MLQILGVSATDKNVFITPYFLRDRKTRTVYMNKTRNVFDICVDKVEFINKIGTPLYQLEIEFIGMIGEKKLLKHHKLNITIVNNDFMLLRKIIMKEYKKLGIKLQDSNITKAQWALKWSS